MKYIVPSTTSGPVCSAATSGRIDRWKPIQLGLHSRELIADLRRRDQSSRDHRLDIREIASVSAVDFRQSLCNEVIVPNGEAPNARDQRTTVLPTGWDRNELIRRCQFDVPVDAISGGYFAHAAAR